MIKNPFDGLEKLFHEPKRLAIVSTLCAHGSGVCFAELRATCDLTDGNLNRHLRTLEKAGAVVTEKCSEPRPITRIYLTDQGLEDFHAYLASLESVLERAAEALRTEEQARKPEFAERALTVH